MINYYFFLIIGTACIGLTAGLIGVFLLLRKQSLLGDTLSHAALPGMVLTLLLTKAKQLSLLLLGGSITAACGAALIHFILQTTRLKKDTALGIILSVFFGTGLLLLTLLQKKPITHQALLTKLFLGKALTSVAEDSYLIVTICLALIFLILLFWKEYKLICFDIHFASSIGHYVSFWSSLLLCMMIITICLALHTMGVILTSSLLIAPATAARQWCKRLESMSILATLIGGLSSVTGIIISSSVSHIPTGPIIVIILSISVTISLIFSKKRVQAYELDPH